jgi:hypothetical protein
MIPRRALQSGFGSRLPSVELPRRLKKANTIESTTGSSRVPTCPMQSYANSLQSIMEKTKQALICRLLLFPSTLYAVVGGV